MARGCPGLLGFSGAAEHLFFLFSYGLRQDMLGGPLQQMRRQRLFRLSQGQRCLCTARDWRNKAAAGSPVTQPLPGRCKGLSQLKALLEAGVPSSAAVSCLGRFARHCQKLALFGMCAVQCSRVESRRCCTSALDISAVDCSKGEEQTVPLQAPAGWRRRLCCFFASSFCFC